VTIAVRAKPGASRTRVGGSHLGPYGPALVVAVSARAVDGAANDAVVDAVAAALGIRRRDISLRVGRASRDKLLVLEADRSMLDRIASLRDG
jgi:uncharacterized protein YggU (UPF0235/DUF167 family)